MTFPPDSPPPPPPTPGSPTPDQNQPQPSTPQPHAPQPHAPQPQAPAPNAPDPSTPTPTSGRPAWILPTLIVGLVLLVGAAVVLVILLLGRGETDPAAIPSASPSPSASAEATPDPTPTGNETETESPEPSPSETAAPTDPDDPQRADPAITPIASWSANFSDRYPDDPWTQLVDAASGHETHFNQVIVLLNFSHLVAMDEITGEIQWERTLPDLITNGQCSALARDDLLACSLQGPADNSGYVVLIDLNTGEIVETSGVLPYVPVAVHREGDDYLVSGYYMGLWDEDYFDGVGGTPATVYIWRGPLSTIADTPVWFAAGEPTYLGASEIWTGAAKNDGVIAAYVNEASIVVDLDSGELLWDRATAAESFDYLTVAGITEDDSYFVTEDRHLTAYNRDGSPRFDFTFTGWTAQFVTPEVLLAGGAAYDAQTGAQLYEIGSDYSLFWAGKNYGIALGTTGSHAFDLNTGAELWPLPADFGPASPYWATGDTYLSTIPDVRDLTSYDLRTGSEHWRIPLTAEELWEPISTSRMYPVRTANSYAWLSGDFASDIYVVVFGGLGEGWALTNHPM